jgi:short-subunit dehydrogenase
MKDLGGANAIVTGASRGLGVGIARHLAAAGVNLALAARSAEQLEQVRDDLVGLGVKAAAIPTDVTVASQRAELVERATGELGPIDILINNAGVEMTAAYQDMDPSEIEETIAINLTAAMLLTRAVLPGMLERGKGHVVNIASGAGKAGVPYGVPYSATKFGLVGATQALRAEHLDSPVGFSVICPGFVTDEGMYARFEAAGLRAPRLVGTTTPDKVARAVVRAIKRNRVEMLVSDMPLRPLVVLGNALPQSAAPLMKGLGLTDFFRRAAESRR